MRTNQELQALLDKLRPLVNEGHPQAEVIWDTLRWVRKDEDAENPFDYHIGED